MEKILTVVLALFVSGCAVVTAKPSQTSAVNTHAIEHTFPSAEAIRKLIPGVSREEALTLIGRTVTTGYELKEGSSAEYRPVTLNHPSRSQKITKGSNAYEVDFYLTHIRKADGTISDDELTPLVFQDNKLIGKGWEFFKEKIK